MPNTKELLERMRKMNTEEPEDLSVLDKFYADDNKNAIQNLVDYLSSKEYANNASKVANTMTESAMEGNIGIGSMTKAAGKALNPTIRNILDRVKSPEAAQALQGVERTKYLKALNLAYGDKAKRASDMGFGKETYYHGTNKSFNEFDPKQLDKSITREQFWMSDNPDVANVFAKSKGHNDAGHEFLKIEDDLQPVLKKLQEAYPKKLSNMPKRVLNHIVEDGVISPEDALRFQDYNNRLDKLQNSSMFNKTLVDKGEQVYPLKVRRTNTKELDAQGNNWQEVKEGIGNDEILVKNVVEDVRPGYATESIAPLGNSLAVKDPAQIRSTSANFDPRFKDSKNLLAQILGTLGAGKMMSEDEE